MWQMVSVECGSFGMSCVACGMCDMSCVAYDMYSRWCMKQVLCLASDLFSHTK